LISIIFCYIFSFSYYSSFLFIYTILEHSFEINVSSSGKNKSSYSEIVAIIFYYWAMVSRLDVDPEEAADVEE